jgi:hypothetical protein
METKQVGTASVASRLNLDAQHKRMKELQHSFISQLAQNEL